MPAASPTPDLDPPAGPPAHIVDVLIQERAPHLSQETSWPVLRPALYALLGYRKARALADAVATMDGRQAFEHLSKLLALKVTAVGLERIPRKGRLVIICNHPSSVADGIAVYDAIKAVRPDLIFFANADAFRVCPQLDEMLIPIEWVEEKRTREHTRQTLDRAKAAFEAERAVVIFPAGQLARCATGGVLTDDPWAPSALSLARKFNATVVPMHLTAPTSTLFHIFDRISEELRDITLFHELLNKRRGKFALRVGPPIAARALDSDAVAATAAMKVYVEQVLPAEQMGPAA
jgi:putative hemolysin